MSPRILSDEERAELERLRARAKTIWEFMSQRSELVRDLAAQAASALEAAYAKGDLKALRLAAEDDVEWIGSLSKPDQDELKRVLRERTGFDFDQDARRRLEIMRKVIRRGRIQTDDEFRLVRGYLDALGKDLTAEERTTLASILREYES